MADTLSIEAKTQLAQALSQLNALAASLGVLGKQGQGAAMGADRAGGSIGKMSDKNRDAKQSTDKLSGALGTLQGALAAVGIGQYIKDSTELFVQQEQAINILAGATGSIPAAREELERWRQVTETLGLEFNKSSVLYARLMVTAQQAGIPIENARSAADGLAIAQRAMNLSSYDAELAFRALGQIANKTVVNMEELRQQLGERVAGVMLALSNKMNITTRELFKLAETGELSADIFFQKFGPAMAEAFKDQAVDNAGSLAANLERIGNAGRRIQVEFSKGFGDELNRSIEESVRATKGAESGFNSLGRGIGVAVSWIGQFLGQFNKIRAVFAEVQSWAFSAAAAIVEFSEDSLQALGDLYRGIGAAADKVGLDTVAKKAKDASESLYASGKVAGENAQALRDLSEASHLVASEQLNLQRSADGVAGSTTNAKDAINALADGAQTAGAEFNKLDPEVAKFIDRMNDLGEKSNVAVVAIKKLMDDNGGALSPSQLAAARNEVEKLVRAYDFKDIPPDLMEVAKALGVSTTETKKNTEATKQASAAQRELLQEINKVTDALQRQADSSKEAAENSRKEIAELEEKNLTGIDPEELNRLNELKDKQATLDRKAKEDAQAASDAQLLLNEANKAAGQTAEVASAQYDKAATSLLGVEQASANARDRLVELQAAFAASGGAAGRFAVPGGSPSAPGGAVGPQGPIPPGAAPLGQGFGPNANEPQFRGLNLNPSGPYGNTMDGFTQAPIDLFNALDTGTSAFSSEEIAKMMVENMFGSFEDQMAQAMAEYNATYANGPASSPGGAVRITTKDTSLGKSGTNAPSGGFVGPAQQAQTLITNVEEAADQAGEVLVDSFDDGSKSMFNLGLAAKDTSKSVEGVGDAAGDLAAPLEGAAAAAKLLPNGITAAGEALEIASASSIDYTQAINRAEGATGDLGITAAGAAGSIADAAGASRDLAEQAYEQARKAVEGQAKIQDAAQLTTKELIEQVKLYMKINELIGGKEVDVSDVALE